MPNVIFGFFIMVEMLVSALLIGVVLLQKSKGGMGGSAFGGGMGEAIFGSRMGNVLTKATVILGIIFLVNTILLTIFTARRSDSSSEYGSVTDGQAPIEQPAPIGGIAPAAAPMASPAPTGPIEIPPIEVEVDTDAVAPIEIPAPTTEAVPEPEVAPVIPAPEAIPAE